MSRQRILGLLLAAVLVVSAVPVASAGTAERRAASDDTIVATARASLRGEAERPDPVDTRGRGQFRARFIESGEILYLCIGMTWRRLSTNVVAAHIHEGGPDVAGPVLIDFDTVGLRHGKVRRCLDVSDVETEAEEFYVNVHTTKYPAGEIRGQLRFRER